ncbi:hypothetical protein TEA_005335 [Camellia sinensis var. sinensis]|uniref:Glycosyltransferase 2-like domain-containing protein n=1 Tax=Camellia sinensis var. sinensis TaxID=542762 RepID=A0A4S4ER59_CAMSN|nr:hypothetical protein TEA_005335 [Camellia sinensis var. sinensis]
MLDPTTLRDAIKDPTCNVGLSAKLRTFASTLLPTCGIRGKTELPCEVVLLDKALGPNVQTERQFNGMFINFFGFNGTAGVWRIKALEESGGWFERTTVEDMDIAVRAHLNGWKFIFLNDVRVLCELPESYEAYKKQQHRWHSGPMQLFRLCLPAILTSKISMWKKANMIFLFFLLRKLILPFYSFTLFCVILPLAMFIPEAELPLWVVCYVPVFMSFLNVLPSPKSFPFLIPYLLFENNMSGTKFNAMVSGLFQLGSGYSVINSGVMKDREMPFFARHILSSL